MKVLELFSGTGSVSKVCHKLGYDVVSLDLKDAMINCNILDWNYKDVFPIGHFDIIWASPPCSSFSVIQNTRRSKEDIYKNIEQNGLPILNKTLEIIDYFKPTYFFIENPQTGRMKEYVKFDYIDVDYCMYSDWGYRKRTRVWTNKKDLIGKLCNKECGNMIKDIDKNGKVRHIHRYNIAGNNQTQRDLGLVHNHTSLKERYRVPEKLITYLITQV